MQAAAQTVSPSASVRETGSRHRDSPVARLVCSVQHPNVAVRNPP